MTSVPDHFWVRNRPAERPHGVPGVSGEVGGVDDGDLVQRVVNAYRAGRAAFAGDASLWTGVFYDLR